jgi:hypothetical protein
VGFGVATAVASDELEIPAGGDGGLGVGGHDDTDQAEGENGDQKPVAAGRVTHVW